MQRIFFLKSDRLTERHASWDDNREQQKKEVRRGAFHGEPPVENWVDATEILVKYNQSQVKVNPRVRLETTLPERKTLQRW
ncbi:MAG: hypothetical protein A2X66_03690 [Ignavibacteria bacterium GWA2_54_16]|nr:MAG: hypothetical protein A2X66_03690 [Ignavibacteria bacterium GWA2_54_16]